MLRENKNRSVICGRDGHFGCWVSRGSTKTYSIKICRCERRTTLFVLYCVVSFALLLVVKIGPWKRGEWRGDKGDGQWAAISTLTDSLCSNCKLFKTLFCYICLDTRCSSIGRFELFLIGAVFIPF